MRKTAVVTVVEHDPAWPQEFARLRSNFLRAMDDIALAIEYFPDVKLEAIERANRRSNHRFPYEVSACTTPDSAPC